MASIDDFFAGDVEDKPLEEVGIGGFTTLSRVNETVSYTSQAPSTFVENGTSISDHIVLEPLIVTIDGEISDIFIKPSNTFNFIKRVNQLISGTTIFLPSRLTDTTQRINSIINDFGSRIFELQSRVDNYNRQILNIFGNKDLESKSLRERFVDAMESLHYGRQLVSIDMPFRRYDNMRIIDLQITRNNQDEALKFKITAQKVRIAETFFTEINVKIKNPSTDNNGQSDSEKDKGTQKGEEPNEEESSLLSDIIGAATGG